MVRCSYCNLESESPTMFTVPIKGVEKQFYGCSDKCINKTNAFWRYALRTQLLF
jgi:hypothetical protein